VYRRQDILQNSDLLEDGFWEPSFHRRFRQAGLSLQLKPDLCVTHENCYTNRQFIRQRLAHGKAFGIERAENITKRKRGLLILLSPLLPFVFLSKIVVKVLSHGGYTVRLLQALPWLLLFLFAWGLGEAKGYLAAGRGENSNTQNNKGMTPDDQ